MLETMTKLQTVYLSSGSQGTISFTNIPQNYTDLCVKVSVRSTYASTYYDNMILTFNGSSSGYSFARGIGIGNGTSIDGPFVTQSNIYIGEVPAVTATTSTFSNNEIYLPNYSGNTPKQVNVDKTLENTSTTYILGMVVGLWNNTSPINSINLSLASGSFAQFSEVTLYGVKAMRTAVGNSIKATGGAISFDGTYVTHTFSATDTFITSQPLNVDYLVVAGGGGGGGSTNDFSGGGGAGGYRTSSNSSRLNLSPNSYGVIVGAGGATGVNGTDSSFASITSSGGGRGNNNTYAAGGAGGSGGGERTTANASNTVDTGGGGAGNTPATSPSQGNSGGNGWRNYVGAGGGGGAGAVGSDAAYTGSTCTAGGAGGAGAQWLNGYYYAGGGGGAGNNVPAGAGGIGGGGAGFSGSTSSGGNGTAGTANTGGGAGGTAYLNSGASGGSGIVIVRYKA